MFGPNLFPTEMTIHDTKSRGDALNNCPTVLDICAHYLLQWRSLQNSDISPYGSNTTNIQFSLTATNFGGWPRNQKRIIHSRQVSVMARLKSNEEREHGQMIGLRKIMCGKGFRECVKVSFELRLIVGWCVSWAAVIASRSGLTFVSNLPSFRSAPHGRDDLEQLGVRVRVTFTLPMTPNPNPWSQPTYQPIQKYAGCRVYALHVL